MEKIILPDGQFIHPAQVAKIEAIEHTFSSKFYVRVSLSGGRTIDIQEKLDKSVADALVIEYQEKVQAVLAEISGYREGYDEGYANGQASGDRVGFQRGFTEGRRQANAVAWDDAVAVASANTITKLREMHDEYISEAKYSSGGEQQEALLAARLIDRLIARLTPPAPEISTHSSSET